MRIWHQRTSDNSEVLFLFSPVKSRGLSLFGIKFIFYFLSSSQGDNLLYFSTFYGYLRLFPKEYVFRTDPDRNKIIDRTDPNWWEDKKNPERCGIRVPELDENGEQKLDKKGGRLWKRERVDATGWDRKEMVELWRASCCEAINKRSMEYGYDIHLDHRSFQRQGIERTPEVHEGYMARKMEQDGLVADRCQINRDIREYNSLLYRIRQVAKDITTTIVEKAKPAQRMGSRTMTMNRKTKTIIH